MKKKKKLKILEIIILSLIIISVFCIYLISKDFLSTTPNASTSNKVSNYVKEKKISYYVDISNVNKYNIPSPSNISTYSTFEIQVSALDNYIKTYTEIITIFYINDLLATSDSEGNITYTNTIDQDTLKNYCNSFNEVEYYYQYTCTYSNNKLLLNVYLNLDGLASSVNKPSKDYDIDINLDDSLYKLTEKLTTAGIAYEYLKE